MRSLVVALAGALALAAHTPAARADVGGFAEVLGGISIPLGDDNWTKIADTSPNLSLRIGGETRERDRYGGLGLMLQGDWTPVNLNNSEVGTGGLNASAAGERGRILANLVFHHRVAPRLIASGRFGIGVDIAHYSYTVTAGDSTTTTARTDGGLALEFGAGIWYSLGGLQIGGELAVPIANHSTAADSSGIGFQYASYDFDVQIGVRFVTF